MLIGLVILCVVVMAAFPDTPFARWLHRFLVDAPAVWLSRKISTRAKVMAALAVVAILTAQLAPDLMPFVAGAGDAAVWLLAFADGSMLLEVMLLVWLATATGGLKTAWRGARSVGAGAVHVLKRLNAPRASRARRQRPKARPIAPPSEDPDPALAGAFA